MTNIPHFIFIVIYLLFATLAFAEFGDNERKPFYLDVDFNDDESKQFLSVRAAEEQQLAVLAGVSRPLFGEDLGPLFEPEEQATTKLFIGSIQGSPIKDIPVETYKEQARLMEANRANGILSDDISIREPPRPDQQANITTSTDDDNADTTMAKRTPQAPLTTFPPPPEPQVNPIQAALDSQAAMLGQETSKEAQHVAAQLAARQPPVPDLPSTSGLDPLTEAAATGMVGGIDGNNSSNNNTATVRPLQIDPNNDVIAKLANPQIGEDTPTTGGGGGGGATQHQQEPQLVTTNTIPPPTTTQDNNNSNSNTAEASKQAREAAAFILALERDRELDRPLDATVTRRMLRDSEYIYDNDEDGYPEPQLFTRDRPNARPLTIWTPDDPLPRDVLNKRPAEVWLYSLLAADFGGVELLPHFLEHYARLGVKTERMLFIVNYNPKTASSSDQNSSSSPLQKLTAILDAWGADYRVWLGQYSADAHLKYKLEVLQRVPVRDWIIITDSDEFHDYGGMTAPQFLEICTRRGYNWVKGYFVDRVAEDGRLTQIQASPAIWLQYPFKCDVARRLAHGDPSKITAFRGFLRSGVGNHGIIPPEVAEEYFGPAAPGEESPRYGLCGAEDLFPLTPYSKYWMFYKGEDVTGNSFLWAPKEAEFKVCMHHHHHYYYHYHYYFGCWLSTPFSFSLCSYVFHRPN
jgi:hypothetical protein